MREGREFASLNINLKVLTCNLHTQIKILYIDQQIDKGINIKVKITDCTGQRFYSITNK